MKEFGVTVAEIEADKAVGKPEAPEPKVRPKGLSAQLFGLVVSDLTEAQKKELKIKSGVRIEESVDGAARAGLREGDVILAVGNTEIASVRDLEAALSKQDKKKTLNVLYRRGDWTQFALIKPTN
jgi:serine protease Do